MAKTIEEQLDLILDTVNSIQDRLDTIEDSQDEIKEQIANIDKDGSGFSTFTVDA